MMEFEDFLAEVGNYGKYQKKLTFLFLVPVSALLPMFIMNTLFMVSTPDHWCNVPQLDQWNLTLEQQLLLRPSSDPKCSMYDLNYSKLLDSPEWNWVIPENTTTTKCLYGYRYDKSNYERTASTEWNFVCEDSHYSSLVLTLGTVGNFLGAPLYGRISDRVGRKTTMFLIALVVLSSGVASVLVTNFITFAVLRTITGSAMPAMFQAVMLILMEVVGPLKRSTINSFSNCSWTIGLSALPLVAWLCRDWVLFGLVTSSAPLFFFLYWKFLPESPRWLLSQKRYAETAKVMCDIAKTNGKPYNQKELPTRLKEANEECKEKKEKTCFPEEDVSAVDLIRYPNLRKHFLIITLNWVACAVSYYGLQFNFPNLGGNEFVNFFLLSIIELPSAIFGWYLMEKCGRRWVLVVISLFSGIVLLIPLLYEPADVAASVIGKFGSVVIYMISYQQSAELYPTALRATGLGLNATAGAICTIAVPYMVFLAEYNKSIPFLVVSSVFLMSGCAASFLPETLNEVLPQTIADAEIFGKDQKFFSCNRHRRHCEALPTQEEHSGWKRTTPVKFEKNDNVLITAIKQLKV